ncbi:hypothetical protein H4R34_006226, partial [Dimargaris verticillata]
MVLCNDLTRLQLRDPESPVQRQSILQLFESKTSVNICAPMVRYSKLPFRELVR